MSTPLEKFQLLLRELFQFDCADLDFGGGLGIPYFSPREKFAGTAQAYARTIITPLRGRPIHLLLEPSDLPRSARWVLHNAVEFLLHDVH